MIRTALDEPGMKLKLEENLLDTHGLLAFPNQFYTASYRYHNVFLLSAIKNVSPCRVLEK